MANYCSATSTKAETEEATQRLNVSRANQHQSTNLTNAPNLNSLQQPVCVQCCTLQVLRLNSSRQSPDPAF